MVSLVSSTHDEAAIHRDRLASYVACCITAKPQNSICNLLGSANPSHRDTLLHRLEGFTLTARDHLVRHRRVDQARTYGIDADAPCRIFVILALAEPKLTVPSS